MASPRNGRFEDLRPEHVRAVWERYQRYLDDHNEIDLDGPDLEYTYLLVRTTGDYLVKRRIGEITETLADWTPHAAIRRVESEGDEPVNTLAVDVEGGEVHFVVNGEVVHAEAVGRARPYGTAGVRVNHRLDVRVDHWALTEGAGAS